MIMVMFIFGFHSIFAQTQPRIEDQINQLLALEYASPVSEVIKLFEKFGWEDSELESKEVRNMFNFVRRFPRPMMNINLDFVEARLFELVIDEETDEAMAAVVLSYNGLFFMIQLQNIPIDQLQLKNFITQKTKEYGKPSHKSSRPLRAEWALNKDPDQLLMVGTTNHDEIILIYGYLGV